MRTVGVQVKHHVIADKPHMIVVHEQLFTFFWINVSCFWYPLLEMLGCCCMREIIVFDERALALSFFVLTCHGMTWQNVSQIVFCFSSH